MTVLDIPYVSQEDEGADINGKEIHNDCGPTCGVMLIRAYTPEKTFTVNQFYKEMGFKKEGFTNNTHIREVLKKHGISSEWRQGLKISDLETFVNQKRPPITLINYKALRQNGITTYNRSATFHFVVIVGIDGSFVYLNDPLWPGTKGKNLKIPREIWLKAWGGKSFLNKKGEQVNSQFQALIPDHPLDAEEMKPPEGSIQMKVIFDDYMNVRSGPGTNNKKQPFTIASGAYVTILETKTIGDAVWGKLGEDEWIAVLLDDKTYLEPVASAVEDPGDKSTIDQKEDLREENKMSDKLSVKAGDGSKDDLSMEVHQNLDDLTLGAIMGELREIKAMLRDMMASGNLETKGQTEDEFILEEPISNTTEEPGSPEEPISSIPEEPVVNYVEVFTEKQKGLVNLSFIKQYNGDVPVFEFFPGDSKPPAERIQIKTGKKLKVIPGSQKVGDGGRTGWKLDKNEYIPRTKRSASIPPGTDLYIEEKFIKSFSE